MGILSLNIIQQHLFRKPFGIHSPFLFRFANECIYTRKVEPEFTVLEELRSSLKNDTREIQVTDYGKGPRMGPKRKNHDHQPLEYSRKVRDIASTSLQRQKYCRLFFHMVRYFQPDTVLELGTSLGLSASYFALGRPQSKIYTLEGCPQTAAIARSVFARAGAGNVELIVGEFAESLPHVLEKCASPDMIYIDGNHSFEGVLRNFTAISDHLHDNSIVIIDDIRWSKSMTAAWKQLVAFEKTTLAVDLGKIGILFFKPELSKQLIRIGF